MKIRVDKFLIITIYILSFLIAISQLRYQLLQQPVWSRAYNYAVYLTIICCFAVFVLDLMAGKLAKLPILLVGFIIYELLVSYATGMTIYMRRIIIDVLPWPLLWGTSYLYFRKNEIPRCFNYLSIVGLAICSVLSVPNISRHLIDYGRRGGVIFPIYFTFAFLTMILLVSSKNVKRIFMVIVSALLIASTKRTGAAIAIVGILLYFFTDAFIASNLRDMAKKYFRYIVMGSIIAIISLYWINSNNIQIFERFMAISDDGGSSRIYIWEDIMNHFRDSTLLEQVFGHGFHAVYYNVQPYGFQRMAHNSFIETLYDYGYVGLVYLLTIIFKISTYWINMLRNKNEYAPVMSYTIVCLLFLSSFSYFFEQTVIIVPFAIAWGIIMGRYDAKRELESI